MRIEQLDLRAVGPFENTTLQFPESAPGLWIVHGPNEAGKSSALRALRYWLFGFPSRLTDNFRHANKRLRVGGVLVGADGQRLEFLRRKTRQSPLRTLDDKTVIDGQRLDDLLQGLTDDRFKQQYGIDHKELREGGHAIVSGSGDLGEILFSAGAGIGDLSSIQQGLEKRMAELFKPSGSKPKVNALLLEVKNLQKATKQKSVKPAAWTALVNQIAEKADHLEELKQRLNQARQKKNRLERISRSQILISELDHIKTQISELGETPHLPDGFDGQRGTEMTRFSQATESAQNARSEIQRLEKRIAQQTETLEQEGTSLQLADLRQRIQELHDESIQYRRSRQERIQHEGERKRLRQEAEEGLKKIGHEPDLDQAAQMKLTQQHQIRIRNLAQQCQAVLAQHEQAEKGHAKTASERQQCDTALAQLDPPCEIKTLQHALRSAQSVGDIDQQSDNLHEKWRQHQKKSEAGLKQLGLFSGTLQELEQLALPGQTTIADYANKWAEAESELQNLNAQIKRFNEEIADLDHQLDELASNQLVPSEEALQQVRADRDRAWEWLRLSPADRPDSDDPHVSEFLSTYFPGGTLPDAFYAAVRKSDDLSDRLRTLADQVAQHNTWTSQRRKKQKQLERRIEEKNDAEQKKKTIEAQWEAEWTHLGISPRTPREMQEWLPQRQQLIGLADEGRQLEFEKERLAKQRSRLIEELQKAIGEAGLTVPASLPDDRLAPWVHAVEEMVETVKESNAHYDKLVARQEELKRQEKLARENLDEAQAKLDAWRKDWGAAVEKLGFDEEAIPDEVHGVIDTITDVFKKIEKANQLDLAIDTIDEQAKAFETELDHFCQSHGLSVKERTPDDLADWLHRQSQSAADAKTKLTNWNEQLENARSTLQTAQTTIEQAGEQLNILCQQAGCESRDDLSDVIVRSTKLRELLAEKGKIEQALIERAGQEKLEDWIHHVRQTDHDALHAEQNEIEDAIKQMELERDETSNAKGRLEGDLEEMEKMTEGVAARADIENALALLRTEAEKYIRLKLASVVLERSIEHYREANKSPVLKRASELFCQLTLESFDYLQQATNDKGDPILVGVRGNDRQEITVDKMSEGTGDQLYLALRIALLEQTIDPQNPVPLIVDDILVMFDEERAKAAMRILAELGKTTQVIFFTHHQHLIELAIDALGATRVDQSTPPFSTVHVPA